MDIRHGRMTREQGIALVKEYDSVEPSTLGLYCEFMGITKKDFYDFVAPMRDLHIWKQNSQGDWQVKDAVWLHDETEDTLVNKARPKMAPEKERTFSKNNQSMFYNPKTPPLPTGEKTMDEFSSSFEWI